VPLSKNWASESNSGFQNFKKGVSKAILKCLFLVLIFTLFLNTNTE